MGHSNLRGFERFSTGSSSVSPGVQPPQWEPHCHSMPAAMVGLWHLVASLSAKNGIEGFAMLL